MDVIGKITDFLWGDAVWLLKNGYFLDAARAGIVSLLYLAAGVAAGALVLWLCFFNNFKASKSHGGARFATLKEAAEVGLVTHAKDLGRGIICGKTDKKNKYIVLKNKHLFLCAPTGAGKGVGSIISTLLTYQGSVIVNDPKGECYFVTQEARAERGQEIYLLAPYGTGYDKHEQHPRSRFNPLDFIDPLTEAGTDKAQNLAETLVGKDSADSGDFWKKVAKQYICAMILHVCESEKYKSRRNLGTVRDLLALETDDLAAVFKEAEMESKNITVQNGAKAFAASWQDGQGAKMTGSIMQTITESIQFIDSVTVRKFFEKTDVDLFMLNHKPMSVYFVINPQNAKNCEKIASIIYNTALEGIYGTERTATIKKNEVATLFMLDEFPQLSYMPEFERAMGIIRSYGAVMYIVIQNKAQLKRVYKEGAATFPANAASLYIGAQDLETAEELSKLLGNKTVVGRSGDNKKVSFSEVAQPLLSVTELISEGNNNTILLPGNNSKGQGCRPVKMGAVTYYNDNNFKDLAADNVTRDSSGRTKTAAEVGDTLKALHSNQNHSKDEEILF